MKPHRYLPVSDTEYKQEMKDLGIQDADDLFHAIPAALRGNTTASLQPAMGEVELRDHFETTGNGIRYSFIGGNGHVHYIPSIIAPLISRGEFLTAYTPYQPEVSQGTLQAMFEYQSMMANLMGADLSNASLYDGSTAMLEACYMAQRISQKSRILFSSLIHPEYIETMKTYSLGEIFTHDFVATDAKGRIDLADLANKKADAAALVVQSPNYYGIVEDIAALKKALGDVLLIVVVTEAMSLALLRSPGSLGADIVCGEAQSFGIPLSFGGPWLGFLGASTAFTRNMPGRLIGEARDANGERAFVVTLATREQHIRREKATSNICTNQGLMALRCAIYLSVMGKQGLRTAAERSAAFAALGRRKAVEAGLKVLYPESSIFNEFVIETAAPAERVFEECAKQKIAPGAVIGENRLLAAFNETMSPEIVERWAKAVSTVK